MKNKIVELYDLIMGKEMGILPGNLAFSFFLAIIPILTLIFFITTSFHLPMDIIQNFLNQTFPSGVVDLLEPIFTDTITFNSLVTLTFGLVVATNGCNAIIMASNTIYNVENAPLLKRLIKSFILTICIILLFAFVLMVPLLGRSILSLISTFTDFLAHHEVIVKILYFLIQFPVSLLVIFFFIKLVYTIAPDATIPSKYVNKGALFTTITWLLITSIFSYYINNIAKYDLIYGNLANIVMLLLWFYALAYVFVIGLYLNKTISDAGIEKTNSIKLGEIREKVKKEKYKK
ncbi:MAG: YihY/virulence factor BrkB family protein [Tenericutes bacterium]|nr:YihY/virulence factor BrkB family protein [Mycoplasmatota bacterium]